LEWQSPNIWILQCACYLFIAFMGASIWLTLMFCLQYLEWCISTYFTNCFNLMSLKMVVIMIEAVNDCISLLWKVVKQCVWAIVKAVLWIKVEWIRIGGAHLMRNIVYYVVRQNWGNIFFINYDEHFKIK